MSIGTQLRALDRYPPVRLALVITGFLLVLSTPIIGPIPGPGGTIVFAAGLTLMLRYSQRSKRIYVRLKRRWPKHGAWLDWGLRRASAKRRIERDAQTGN